MKVLKKQEVKKRIRFNYRKEFHSEHLCYFYQHRNNGTFRWDKPALLGRSDLPAPKRWYHVRDSSFEPGASYWLKPNTADMTFDVSSLNCTMCAKHPNEFAARYCTDCIVTVCESCYHGKSSPSDTDPNIPINPTAGELKNHRKHKAVELECGRPLRSLPLSCDACRFVVPSGKCEECETLYCSTCFRSYHENEDYPEYNSHQLVALGEENRVLVDEFLKAREEERMSHSSNTTRGGGATRDQRHEL